MLHKQAWSSIGLLALSAVVHPVAAQGTARLDLSLGRATDTVRVLPGSYTVMVTSLVPLPDYNYTVRVALRTVEIAPIPAFIPAGGATSTKCPKSIAAHATLKSVKKEEGVPAALEEIKDALEKEDGTDTDATCADARNAGRAALQGATKVEPETYSIAPGQYLVVTVHRDGKQGARDWEKVFTTGPRGEWRTSYGFAFPVLGGFGVKRPFSTSAGFFSRQLDTAHFQVASVAPRTQTDALPMAMFSFAPSGDPRFYWSRFIAGIGIDLKNPVFMLGTGLTYNSNVSVFVALGTRQERFLLSKYSVGDTVKTELTPDQLTEQRYAVRFLIGGTIRFDKNPFKSGDAGEAGKEKPKPATPKQEEPEEQSPPPEGL